MGALKLWDGSQFVAFGGSPSSTPYIRRYRSTVQGIATGSAVAVNFDQITYVQNLDGSSGTSQVITREGFYTYSVSLCFDRPNLTGRRGVEVWINGALIVERDLPGTALDSAAASVTVSDSLYFSVNDTFQIKAFQNSGVSIDLKAGSDRTYMSMLYGGR